VVEVRPRDDGGSTVAMRSKSRLGKGDLGANARRIRAFLADLRARLEGRGAPPRRHSAPVTHTGSMP
jgi:hypothetical protein